MLIGLKKFTDSFNDRFEITGNTCRIMLYKNRLRKSSFVVFSLIFCFIINMIAIKFFYEKKISALTVIDLLNLYTLVNGIFAIFFLPYHPVNFGLNLNRWKFNLIFGLILGFAGMGISITARYVMVLNGYMEFDFVPIFKLKKLLYPGVCLAQDFMVRGVFQSYFVSIFDGSKNNKLTAIFFSSLMFSQLHLTYGFAPMALTFIFSFLLGLFYERSRSLLGVTIIHFFTGAGFHFFSQY